MYIKADGIIEKATKLSQGEVEFVVSTNALDAHGERIDVSGISLKDFKKNPVVLWAHDGFNLPIAKATRVWKDGGKLMAKAQFYLKDEFPNKVYNYIVDGFLNAVSIGGQVDQWGEDGTTIEKMNMKEFSVVSVPANPEAIVASKSLDKDEKSELSGLAKAYARKVASKDENELMRAIENQEQLLATLKELVVTGETQEANEKAVTFRVALRTSQAVDSQAESTIRAIKVKLKEINK